MIENTETPQDSQTPGTPDGAEQVWTYRGYKLRSSDFTTAMVHFFRAEISRANAWRQRLDATTNWAVLTAAAVLSFAFGQPQGHYTIIVLNILLVTMFWVVEARRYRYYELWSSRVRLMETDFFAAMLVPPFGPAPDWAESLAENLLHPHFSISIWEALGRRLRRNYIYIYLILGLALLAKLWLHPQPALTVQELIQRTQIGPIPGWVVIGTGLLFYAFLLMTALLTVTLHEATGEVLPRYGDLGFPSVGIAKETGKAQEGRAWFRHSERRRQLLAFVITDQPQEVAGSVLTEMKRGVTELMGKGMYTGQSHGVLMCALTVTEVAHFKAIVSTVDSKAFMIVSPVQEVLGKGFSPLQEKSGKDDHAAR